MKSDSSFVLTKLIGLTTLIYVVGALLSAVLAHATIRQAVLELSNQNLTAILRSRSIMIEEYFHLTQEQVGSLSHNETIIRAAQELSEGFLQLEEDLAAEGLEPDSVNEALAEFYASEFSGTAVDQQASKLPHSAAGRLAQWVYISENPNSYAEKESLHVSPHDSRFEDAHRKYHPRISKLLNAFDYRDVFLVDPDGNLVYTTQKEIDFGTNLADGQYASTGLGSAFRSAILSEEGRVTMTDFKFYEPSSLEPAAFLAVPLFEKDQRIGVAAFQLSPVRLNRVISDPHGLGQTGETYVVGDDFLMRTDSRFVDDSTILKRKVETEAANAIQRGEEGSAVVTDYRGVEVLSHYRPLDIVGLKWGIIAEMDQSEIGASATRIAWMAIGVLLTVLLCIAITSYFVLRVCVKRPFDQLIAGAREITEGNYSARVHVASKDEFAVLAHAQNEMATAVEDHITRLELALAEVRELQGLLPICAACKSIRDGDGYYKTIETYLVGKSNIEFSHTVCNECIPRLYPDLSEKILSQSPPTDSDQH